MLTGEPSRPAGPLLGRLDTLRHIVEALGEGACIVTLVGLGGIGKTRLAHAVYQGWDGPRAFFDLTAAAGADDLIAAVALGLGMKHAPPATLAARLRDLPPHLIVLDNLESMGEDAHVLVGRLSDEAPAHRWLATSRVPLHLVGERVIPVRPLPSPDAIALFVDTCRRRGATVEPTPAIAELVGRVDCIPLAVELFAAWVPALGIDALSDPTVAPLNWLASDELGRRDPQRSVRAILAWSWSRLPPQAQDALAIASVFNGGASVPTFLRVAVGDTGVRGAEVLRALVDAQLVVLRDQRVRLYETVRAYAAERLEEHGRTEEAVRSHAAYFAEVAAPWRVVVETRGDVEAWSHLAAESSNLLAAFDRSLETDPDLAARLLLCMVPELLRRGPSPILGRRLDALLGRPERLSASRCAEILLARGTLHWARLDLKGTIADLRESDRLARLGGDTATRAAALDHLGRVQASCRAFPDAIESYRAASACFTSLGDETSALSARARAARVQAWQGALDIDACAHALRAASAAQAAAGDPRTAAAFRTYLGDILEGAGRFQEAEAEFLRAEEIYRACDDDIGQIIVSYWLGRLACLKGESARAERLIVSSLERSRKVGYRVIEYSAARLLAVVAHTEGRLQEAADHYARIAPMDTGLETWKVWAAALDASQGFVERATATFEALETVEDKAMDAATVALLRGVVDVALAVSAEGVARASWLARARERLADWEERPPTRLISADARLAGRLLAAELARVGLPPAPQDDVLFVASDGSWFQLAEGVPTSLQRSAVLRHLLVELVRHPARTTVSIDALREAGWPGQSVQHEAAMNRLYVAIRKLRRLGLASVLVTNGEGYMITTGVVVRDAPMPTHP